MSSSTKFVDPDLGEYVKNDPDAECSEEHVFAEDLDIQQVIMTSTSSTTTTTIPIDVTQEDLNLHRAIEISLLEATPDQLLT